MKSEHSEPDHLSVEKMVRVKSEKCKMKSGKWKVESGKFMFDVVKILVTNTLITNIQI
jgi:hypothetical protein